MYDVIIVGGGPAGLSAALVLGRSRRKVLLFDSGQYRNAAARVVHGFLSRDGIDPSELRRIAREQLRPYDSVELKEVAVIDVRRIDRGFEVTTIDGAVVTARKLLLATGVVDEVPSVEGAAELFGCGLHQCPYCDGWEVRDQPLGVYGRGDEKGGGLALEMKQWSEEITLCSDGPSELSPSCRERLRRRGVALREERVIRFEPAGEGIRVVFESGAPIEFGAVFFNTGSRQQSDLAKRLGCSFDERGGVCAGQYEATDVPGVYVAGDTSRDVLLAIVGAGEGCEAAVAINSALVKEDRL
ncbi:MAG TPA: NAD(P)/FAD-dependent oxidoreductase [Terriglobales bacterium]|nr:NAD(P)/FAD-dependent oxidoreductase [Terriglobales bacterium]